MNGLQKAIGIAGSQEKLGTLINVSQQRVSYWAKTGIPPAEFVLEIEAKTGVSRYELRSDLYPKAA